MAQSWGGTMTQEGLILTLLYPNEKIIIGATDGVENFAETDVFNLSYEASPGTLMDLQNLLGLETHRGCVNKLDEATERTPVEVYEIKKEVKYKEIISSLGNCAGALALTQNQVIKFCKSHRGKLEPNRNTFFLFKFGSKLFDASVSFSDYGLRLFLAPFSFHRSYDRWHPGYHRRLVVLKLKHTK